jgi:thioredoxin reductase (NADPH)
MVKIFITVIIIIASMKIEKVIIIGGGPAGLAAAIYNARADLQPLVIAGSPPGGQLTLTNTVENYPGFESILGQELILKMRNQAEKVGARFINQNVIKVDFSQKPLTVYTSDQVDNSYKSNIILIATGAEVVWLGLESEQKLRGKGVSACAICDGFFFRDKVVGVVGGGDSAMEEALTLTKFAKKVYIIHRRDQFRACKLLQKKAIGNPKIELIWNAVVEKVLGVNRVSGVKLKIGNSKIENLSLDGLFIAIGHKPATGFLKGSGVELDEKGYIITSSTVALNNIKYQISNIKKTNKKLNINNETIKQLNNFDFNYQHMTSAAGVFAAGDVIDPIYRQAAAAVGMGVEAALEMERYLSSF